MYELMPILLNKMHRMGIKIGLGRRLIECPESIEVNGKEVKVNRGYQYILSFEREGYYKKTSWYLSEQHDKDCPKEEFTELVLEHLFVLFHMFFKDHNYYETNSSKETKEDDV